MDHILDWLNENELRAYPLLDEYSNTYFTVNSNFWKLPHNLILDLQLLVKNFSLYSNTGYNNIYFKKLVYSPEEGVTITFEGIEENQEVEIFKILNIDGDFPVYVRNESGSLIVLGEGLLEFITACNGNNVELDISVPIEPTTCVEYRGAWKGVTDMTVFPQKKSNPENPGSPKLPLENVSEISQMIGDLNFIEGYNFGVTIENDLINLTVGLGYGLLADCSTHFISDEFLDCSDIVSYINGIPPDESGNFRFIQGENIVLIPGNTVNDFSDNYSEEANSHTLFVSFSFDKTDICAPISPTVI